MTTRISTVGAIAIEDVSTVQESDRALCVLIDGQRRWVPKSVIHDDSEVYRDGDRGTLVVKEWWAEKEGFS